MSYENTSNVEGESLSFASQALETTAKVLQVYHSYALSSDHQQSHEPLKNVCAMLHGYHAYADDHNRGVSTFHYCTHLTEGSPLS